MPHLGAVNTFFLCIKSARKSEDPALHTMVQVLYLKLPCEKF